MTEAMLSARKSIYKNLSWLIGMIVITYINYQMIHDSSLSLSWRRFYVICVLGGFVVILSWGYLAIRSTLQYREAVVASYSSMQLYNRQVARFWRRTLVTGVAFVFCLGAIASGAVMFWEGLGIVRPTTGLTLVLAGAICGIVSWIMFEKSRERLLQLSPEHRQYEPIYDNLED